MFIKQTAIKSIYKALMDITFKNWLGDLEQVDDVCLIGVRV